jgi:hypothetical protein
VPLQRLQGGARSPRPDLLALDRLEPFFGDAAHWQANYETFVEEKIGSKERLWDEVRNRIFLGTDQWIRKVRKIVDSKPRSSDHPARQRAVGRPHMPRVIKTVARLAKSPPARFDTVGADRCGCSPPGSAGTRGGIASVSSRPRSDFAVPVTSRI